MHILISAFLVCSLTFVASQRSPYSPNPVRYPDVAPRFRTPENEAAAADLGNRNGVPDVSTTTIRLPIDARGNVDVVNQINSWPEERRPFWYINSQAIEAARARPVDARGAQGQAQGPQNVQLNVAARSSFLPQQRK